MLVFIRELFRISISNYQDWFKVAVIFWLQTFREECMRRMEKALEIEKDVCLSILCLCPWAGNTNGFRVVSANVQCLIAVENVFRALAA